MKTLTWMGMVLVLAAGCGDSGGSGTARTAGGLCDEVCGWPDQCFAELGAPLNDGDCMAECEASVEVVGVACLGAIADVVSCLGTCDFESIGPAEAEACADQARAISDVCE